jgi:hypothetical protein
MYNSTTGTVLTVPVLYLTDFAMPISYIYHIFQICTKLSQDVNQQLPIVWSK